MNTNKKENSFELCGTNLKAILNISEHSCSLVVSKKRGKMSELLYKELVYNVVGCAMEVHNVLGYGFLEKVYENALMIELRNSNILGVQQCPIKVEYKNEIVGDYIADIIVDNKIVLELKSAKTISSDHVAQTLNYLKAIKFKLGIVINFGENELEYKRLIY